MENENSQKPCPKCDKENPDDTRYGNARGCSLTHIPIAQERSDVKISKLASVSFICASFGLVLLAPSLVALNFPPLLNPESIWIVSAFMVSLIILVALFILGLIGIVQIECSGGRITGRALAFGGVLVPVITALLAAWYAFTHPSIPR
jgi:high-affinity K+ transport system ATPase subunit B